MGNNNHQTRTFLPPLTALIASSFLSLGALGCDEEQIEAPPKASTAAVAPTPTAPEPKEEAAPEPEPEPAKPKKTLADCDKGTTVKFDSADIEAHFRVKASKPKGDFKTADLKKIRSLNFSRIPLSELDICIFQHTKELRELMLGPGTVTDLSPIAAATKLESLIVRMNPIVDLSPLEKLTKLDRLDISNTAVKDLSALAKMTLMTEITLDGAPIEDISALEKMTLLERVSLVRTKVKDVSSLKDMKKLKFLYIAESPLADDISATGVVARNGAKVVSE